MNTLRKLIILLVLIALNAIHPSRAGAQATAAFKVIVNAGNPVGALSKDEVSRLFLKKVTTWSNATPVVVVDQRSSNTVRESFTRLVHGRQLSFVTSYWQQMIFSGRATPPPEKASDAEVSSFVASTPTAIGYVAADAPLPPGVKVLNVKM
jgi:ABC-type phosphate transport system substrate-binding protein